MHTSVFKIFLLTFFLIPILTAAADEQSDSASGKVAPTVDSQTASAVSNYIPYQSSYSILYKVPTAIYLGWSIYQKGSQQFMNAGEVTGLLNIATQPGPIPDVVNGLTRVTAGVLSVGAAVFVHSYLKPGFYWEGDAVKFKRPNWIMRTAMSFSTGIGTAYALPPAVKACATLVSAIGGAF